jgi:hypothetical protein
MTRPASGRNKLPKSIDLTRSRKKDRITVSEYDMLVKGDGKIIKQDKKAPNKTELRFESEFLTPWKASGEIDNYDPHEYITLSIGNGVRYTPDWSSWKDGKLTCYEIKGAYMHDDAIVKLKTAAHIYPYIKFRLFQLRGKRNTPAGTGFSWVSQDILP